MSYLPIITGGLCVLSLNLIYFSPTLLRLLFLESQLQELCSQKNCLVLSYDDGPEKELTPKLLDLLATWNAKASFFVVGEAAEKQPQILNRLVEEGHEIGTHGYRHLNALTVAPWKAVADIHQGYHALAPWISGDAMFRPPFGKITLPTRWALNRHRGNLALWTIDSGDTHKELSTPEAVVDKVITKGGGVVLMHDKAQSRSRMEFVLKTTDLLLQGAQKEGLEVKTLGEIL